MEEEWARKSMLGVVTGVSYVSGIDYFRGINEHVSALWKREKMPTRTMEKNARMVMACVDCDIYVNHLEAGEHEKCAEYLFMDGVKRVHAGGADILVIASNTAHIVCPLVASRLPAMRVLHIADCIAMRCRELGVTYAGLLGTKPTMEAVETDEKNGWLKARLKAHGIKVAVPERAEDRRQCYDIICHELSFGEMKAESRNFFSALGDDLCRAQGVQAIILGCTEIELLLSRDSMQDSDIRAPLLRSAEIHIECAAKAQLGLLCIDDIEPQASSPR